MGKGGQPERAERLPFIVRQVTHRDLGEVAALRALAYGARSPELGRALAAPEPEDFEATNVVLGAFDRTTDALLATVRLHTNLARPLPLEASVALPDRFCRMRTSEATRLAKRPGVPPLVKLGLFKTFFLFCQENGIDATFAAGRPPLHEQYEALLFEEVYPGAGLIPMRHAGNAGHKLLFFLWAQAEPTWRRHEHPLLDFMVGCAHPELHVPVLKVAHPLAG